MTKMLGILSQRSFGTKPKTASSTRMWRSKSRKCSSDAEWKTIMVSDWSRNNERSRSSSSSGLAGTIGCLLKFLMTLLRTLHFRSKSPPFGNGLMKPRHNRPCKESEPPLLEARHWHVAAVCEPRLDTCFYSYLCRLETNRWSKCVSIRKPELGPH